MAAPAYDTVLQITGTATAITGEAMGGAGAGPYQVTNSAKRVLNPLATVTFYDNGIDCTADVLTVDYLFGKVTFTGSKTGPITVTGEYLPLLTFAEARALALDLSADELDTSVYGSGWKNSASGLMQLTVDVENLALLTYDMDSGAGTRKLSTVFTSRIAVVISAKPGNVGSTYRSFCYAFGEKEDAAVADLVKTGSTFKSITVRAVDGTLVTTTIGS